MRASCHGCAPPCCSTSPVFAIRPVTTLRRSSTPRLPRPRWRPSTSCSPQGTWRCSNDWARRRPPTEGNEPRRAGARREVVGRIVRRHDRAPPGHQGTRLSRRAHRPARSRAPRARPGRSHRGRCRRGRSGSPGAGRRRRAARRSRPRRLPPPHRGAAHRGRRGIWQQAGSTRPRQLRRSSSSWSPSSLVRTGSAAGSDERRQRPSGPGSTSPGRCALRSRSCATRCQERVRCSTAASEPACTAPTTPSRVTRSAGSFSPD